MNSLSLPLVQKTPVRSLRRVEVCETAALNWGLAPRGARIEKGGPDFGFTLRQKRDVWARELSTIYSQAAANQWSASRDIPWSDLPKLSAEVESAVGQIMTFLTENEFAALYVPARFIPRIHPHYREVVEVLAMQIVDEARHAEAFTRRAEAGGAGLGTTATSGQLSLKTLLEEPDFTTATFLLCVMGEGTFLTLLKFLGEHAPDPVTADARATGSSRRSASRGVRHRTHAVCFRARARHAAFDGRRSRAAQSDARVDLGAKLLRPRCAGGFRRGRNFGPADTHGFAACGRIAARDGSHAAGTLAVAGV